MFRWFKRLFAARELRDQESYHRLLDSIREATQAAGYDFPTVAITCAWLVAREHRGLTGHDLHEALYNSVGDEDVELSNRLSQVLSEVRH